MNRPSAEVAPGSGRAAEESRVDPGTRCDRCGHHFSSDGRFCPFDGEPLARATDWDPSADALLGQIVEQRYAVEALIGEGGMGSVYRVRHVLLGKPFALKALRKDVARDEEIAERFIHEARTAASVSHPGLVQISDFGRLASGEPYFVMELLDGVPLASLLRRFGALPVKRACSIARQVGRALAVVHGAGIVHRDLKPDNIQVKTSSAGDDVKIVDFGLAKVLGAERVTRQGVVFGTPYYMSPEQAMGEPFDHRADIYALGIVLYEMLTGKVPFEAETYTGVLTKHITLEPAPPSQLLGAPGSLGAIEAVVLRCLAKKPERRFSSCAEFLSALDRVPELEPSAPLHAPVSARRAASASLHSDRDAATHGDARRRRFWRLSAVAASAGLGSMLVVALVSNRRSEAPPNAVRAPSVTAPALAVTGVLPAPELAVSVMPTRARASPSASSSALAGDAARPRARTRAPEPAPRRELPPPSPDGIVDPWAR